MAATKPGNAPVSAVVCVAVLGSGSWGTALAMQLARSGSRSILWGRNPDHVRAMRTAGSNERYLPGIAFPAGMEVESSLPAAIARADEVLLAIPSKAFVSTLQMLSNLIPGERGVSWACKGLEPGTGRFLHQAAADLLGSGRPLAVVTGPTFAVEVARGLPTAVTVAGSDPAYSQRMAQALHGGSFRVYTSEDIIGAELGGAVKNVLAIATGICDGLRLGNNARAALITRGLAEMMRLGRVLGASERTLIGLAGVGDLVLTCTGELSRNRRLGLALGAGTSVRDAVAEIGQVVEGVSTAEEVMRLARRHQVDLPISEKVFGIIHQGLNPAQCVRDLLGRGQKPEHL